MPESLRDAILARVGETLLEQARLLRVGVEGVEVTQALQHYRADQHLQDAWDRGADNSVQLVAYKGAWVRVYVRSFLREDVGGIRGVLEVSRRSPASLPVYAPVADHPSDGEVVALGSPDYRDTRESTWATLNFRIPAEQFFGTLQLRVRLLEFPEATTTVVVRPRLVQTLRLRAVMVSYQGPGTATAPAAGSPPPPTLTLAAPTLADLQRTSGLALAAMPVQATGSYAVAGTLAWTLPLDDPRTGPGQCSPNWDALFTQVQQLVVDDGNRSDVVYYGLLPAGIPRVGMAGTPGCGGAGVGIAASGDDGTLLHEIGHGYGFAHTPCGPAGATDDQYPTYEPYPSASIGEFGLDIRTGAVRTPDATRDYMSYCPPRWMSLHRHGELVDHPRLAPHWLAEQQLDEPQQRPFDLEHEWLPDPPFRHEGLRRAPVVAIIGRLTLDQSVRVSTVARVAVEGVPAGTPSSWVAQLLAEDGTVISEAPVHSLRRQGCGCGGDDTGGGGTPPGAFQAFVPDLATGAALRIVDAEEVRWERRPSAEPPRFDGVDAGVAEASLLLRWDVAGADVEVWAQWAQREDGPWHGLAVGLRDGRAEPPLRGLPSGRVLVRLLAHDGFHSTVSSPVAVEVPEQPDEAAILHPREGQVVAADRPLLFTAQATSSAGIPLPRGDLSWVLDGAEVGTGHEVWPSAVAAGEHDVVLAVRGEPVARVRFTARD